MRIAVKTAVKWKKSAAPATDPGLTPEIIR